MKRRRLPRPRLRRRCRRRVPESVRSRWFFGILGRLPSGAAFFSGQAWFANRTRRGSRSLQLVSEPGLAFVPDFSEEFLSGHDVLGTFCAFRRTAVDDAHHAPALPGLADHDFNRIGGGAEDGTDFRDVLNGVEKIDGVGVAHDEDEDVSCGERPGIFHRELAQIVVVAFRAGKARARSFVESEAKLGLGNGVDHGFVHVFGGFDEVGLTNDDVGIGGEFEGYGFEVEHEGLPACARHLRWRTDTWYRVPRKTLPAGSGLRLMGG